MSDDLAIRVRVLDVWDDVVLRISRATPIREVKVRALAAARIMEDPARFLVKFRGAELRDENRSLEDERVPTDAALIVLRGHRTPVY